MKKSYRTLAIAAVAAVSLFSAQSAKAQLLHNAPIASAAAVEMGEDEPVPASSYFTNIVP